VTGIDTLEDVMKISWPVFLCGNVNDKLINGFNATSASIIAPGAQVQRLVTGYSFTEGPAADAAGNLFFTDQPNNRILKWSTDGTISVFFLPAAGQTGFISTRDGQSLGMCGRAQRAVADRPAGKVSQS